jgi:prepilin-type N-terminal cleavage/methylation domain-containing protein
MRNYGFTLVELMIVVAIVGVLAVIAGTAYRKYADKARASEVYFMFGEIRTKEEGYRAENSVYCATSATSSANCNSGNEGTFWPALLAAGEPSAKTVTSGAPWGWTAMGITPGRTQLYCGYNTVAGGPNATDWANAGTRGQQLYNSTQPTAAWWYMSATCDNDGQAAVNTLYTSGKDTTSVVVANEGR